MRVLIIKTTSLGDVVHTLPAVNDAYQALPDITFDWVVEKPFADIPAMHEAVDQVIPVSIRAWRKNLLSSETRKAIKTCLQALRAQPYDLIIDAQGLIKSAVIARLAKGKRFGFDKHCAREGFASYLYQQSVSVDPTQHAITRVRQLFAQSLGYEVPSTLAYGITANPSACDIQKPAVLLLHGTTWPTKHWPEPHWRTLAEKLCAEGKHVVCVWGNEVEKQRAEKICKDLPRASVMPKLSIAQLADLIAGMQAVVAVDTGLAHLSAALGVPTVSLYGPTNPDLTGTRGENQIILRSTLPCSPCLSRDCRISNMQSPLDPPCLNELTPESVLKQLHEATS